MTGSGSRPETSTTYYLSSFIGKKRVSTSSTATLLSLRPSHPSPFRTHRARTGWGPGPGCVGPLEDDEQKEVPVLRPRHLPVVLEDVPPVVEGPDERDRHSLSERRAVPGPRPGPVRGQW